MPSKPYIAFCLFVLLTLSCSLWRTGHTNHTRHKYNNPIDKCIVHKRFGQCLSSCNGASDPAESNHRSTTTTTNPAVQSTRPTTIRTTATTSGQSATTKSNPTGAASSATADNDTRNEYSNTYVGCGSERYYIRKQYQIGRLRYFFVCLKESIEPILCLASSITHIHLVACLGIN